LFPVNRGKAGRGKFDRELLRMNGHSCRNSAERGLALEPNQWFARIVRAVSATAENAVM
jgi:hypothetical protein